MDKDKHLHLQLIQNIVNRLARNSFLIKGWVITLVSAMFILADEKSDVSFVFLAYFPVVSFWILDGFFLWQERLYRDLYKDIRKKEETEIDFSMEIDESIKANHSWIRTILSRTLIIFYGIMIFTILGVMVLVFS